MGKSKQSTDAAKVVRFIDRRTLRRRVRDGRFHDTEHLRVPLADLVTEVSR